MDVSAAARAAAREPDVVVTAQQWREIAGNAQELVAIAEGLKAERDQLREALDMAGVQQREVAKALRIDPTGDSVYLHYQIMAVLDAVRASARATDSREGT